MNIYLTVGVIVIGITAITLAVIQFAKTPRHIKFSRSSFVKDPNVEYALEYTTKEKIKSLLIHSIWLIPLLLLLNYLVFPVLENGSKLYCSSYLGISGFNWFFVLFLWVPMLIIVGMLVGITCFMKKVLKHEQYPLPGQKVYKPTMIIRGTKARRFAHLKITIALIIGPALLIVSLLLHIAVINLIDESKLEQKCLIQALSIQAE